MKDILLIQKIVGNKLTVVSRDNKVFEIAIQEECIWDQFLALLQEFDQIYLDSKSIEIGEVTDGSVLVIDPHYLVPVTSVVDSYSCPRKVYVKHMGADEFGKRERMVQGNLLHDVFSQKVSLQTPVSEAIENAIVANEVDIITNGLDKNKIKEYLDQNAKVFNTISAKGESEVDFENWRYGMHGKLDAKVNNMVIELKSSKIPDERPYFSHNLQMNYYLYLLSEKQEHVGKIFYVSNGLMKMMDPTNLKFREMIIARNYTYLTISGRYIPPVLRGQAMKACRYCFQRDGCRKLCAGTEFMRDCNVCDLSNECNKLSWSKHEIDYMDSMVESLNAEQNIDTRAKYNYSRAGSFEKMDIERMIESGHAILTKKKFSEELTIGGVITTYVYKATKTIYRRGDYVNGYPRNDLHNVVTNYHSLTILDITEDRIMVRSSNYLPDEICIVPSNNPGMHRRSRGAVYRATQIDDKLMQLVKLSLSSKIDQDSIEWQQVKLSNPLKDYNPYQNRAIRSALATKDILLIQGPAGTGKTSVIVEIINQLHQQGKSVLASAFTNMAVDNIGIKLKESGIPFTRIGREQSVSKELVEYLPNDPATFSGIFMQLEPTVILATTTTVAGDQYRDLVFDYAVIDEAAQMTEPDTLKPMLLARKVVLVGDHKQLPPVIRSDIAKDNRFDQSMFERLTDKVSPDHFVRLLNQYRMNDEILYFPNVMFYNGDLKTGAEEIRKQKIEMAKNAILSNSPYTVYTLDSPYLKDDNMTNPQEAWLTALIVVDLLRNSSTKREDIGIITPFRAQVALLRKILPGISIDTVDRYQGSERDVIIFSTITSRMVPIVTDPRRMNVALTRAKKKLVVLVTNPSKRNLSICDNLAIDAQERGLDFPVDGKRTDIQSFINQFESFSTFSTDLKEYFGPIDLLSIETDEFEEVEVSIRHEVTIYLGAIPLPRGKFGEISDEEERSGCTVCYSPIGLDEEAVQCLGCAYFYHFEHLTGALRSIPHCPVCKSGLNLVENL